MCVGKSSRKGKVGTLQAGVYVLGVCFEERKIICTFGFLLTCIIILVFGGVDHNVECSPEQSGMCGWFGQAMDATQ